MGVFVSNPGIISAAGLNSVTRSLMQYVTAG